MTIHNERYLNSEDDTTVGPLEIATDLALLHPDAKINVLRGSAVDHPKYRGQRVFSSGINLTRIYQGKQSYLSFLFRSMGGAGHGPQTTTTRLPLLPEETFSGPAELPERGSQERVTPDPTRASLPAPPRETSPDGAEPPEAGSNDRVQQK